MFNGSDANEFARWVNGNLVYPENAKNDGIQGRLVLQFTICTDGKVRDVKVLRGIDPDLDAEALRVVSSSPDWKPGSVNGKPVNVSYVFPIVFKLRGDKKDGEPTTMTVDNAVGNASIQIRGQKDSVLVLLDGKEIPFSKMSEINPDTIKSISVLKEKAELEQYGEKGRNGVILITSKEQ